MAVLGLDPPLEGYAEQEDRDQGTDSDWGPGRNVCLHCGKAAVEAKIKMEYELMKNWFI